MLKRPTLQPVEVFVSHSGATADRVTLYAAPWWNLVPTLIGEITVGLNPFGITFVA